jgi:Arc/MetJ-type ribon-helix-helix transcriptional regulator
MEVSINLPETWKDFVDSQVSAGDHGTVANYLKALVEEDRKRKAREHVEALLDEGLNCQEEREWTPEVLAELKRELENDAS